MKTNKKIENFKLDSKISDVINYPLFNNYGRLLFPVDRTINLNSSLKEITSSDIFVWYSNFQPNKTVEIVNYLKKRAENNEKVFYNIYTEEEIKKDISKRDTGVFYFKGQKGEKFSIVNAGGGFMYVGAMHDNFPQALEISKFGFNSFALIYRPEYAYEDLAKAICFIHDNSEMLEVDRDNYSLWGGSAGARMAAVLGNKNNFMNLTNRNDIQPASCVIMQYTGYDYVSKNDAPTFACVGKNDWIANWKRMERRLSELNKMGINTEFHSYPGLSHGFGLGIGTAAEGWVEKAINFWKNQYYCK